MTTYNVTDEMVLAGMRVRYPVRDSLGDYNEAIVDEMRQVINAALSAAPTTDEDARTYALEQIEQAQAETTEAVARAEKAEKERDEARESLREANGVVKSLRNVTAREHLDAAWDAAHVPEGEYLPDRAVYISRHESGNYQIERAYVPTPASEQSYERRLLDPPTPKRPEGAEALDEVCAGISVGGFSLDTESLADYLAARGVRVTEDGAS